MKAIMLVFILSLLLLCGCAAVPKYWSAAQEGYTSPEGETAKAAVVEVAAPIVGEPWAVILGHIGALLAGGYAVHKRKQWIDTPTPAKQIN